jgi:hypothetical protein
MDPHERQRPGVVRVLEQSRIVPADAFGTEQFLQFVS